VDTSDVVDASYDTGADLSVVSTQDGDAFDQSSEDAPAEACACPNCTGLPDRGCAASCAKLLAAIVANQISTEKIDDFSVPDHGDSAMAVSEDGKILSLTSPDSSQPCGYSRLMLGVPTESGRYEVTDLTDEFPAGAVSTLATLSFDGTVLIIEDASETKLLETWLDGAKAGPLTEGYFRDINTWSNGSILNNPVVSADGLSLYFQLVQSGQHSPGVYLSTRASSDLPFVAPPNPILPSVFAVYGISSDDLMLFARLPSSLSTYILTRADKHLPFDDPTDAAALPGILFQSRPLPDCSGFIGTMAPGGCGNQDVGLVRPF
jgi:hypothetical protein